MSLRARIAFMVTALVIGACGGGKRSGLGGVTGPTGGTPGDTTGSSGALSIGADASVALGRPQAFTATLTLNGVPNDCTGSATWSSSDPAVATVAAGVASTLAVGQTIVSASCSGVTDTALLTVTPAEVVSIAVTPAAGELPIGLKEQLSAIGTFTDGSTDDVTDACTWSSSAAAFAFLGSDAAGVVTAQGTDGQSADLKAAYAPGIEATVTRTVTAAVLQAIAISPASQTVPLGTDVQFTAIGTYSDGQSGDVTPSVAWASSNTGVASFAGNGPGLASTLGADTVTISATRGAVAATPATLVVTAHAVTSVAIDQTSPTLTVGETLALTCTATYSDGLTAPGALSGATSSVAGVASVTDAGVVTAAADGFATIAASCTADGVSLPASTQVTVVAPAAGPVLSYLSLSPGSVKGGRRVTGTVGLTAPATADTIIQLGSSSTYVTVPPTVTILTGHTTATFQITTSHPPSKRKVTITASLGAAQKKAILNLRK